MKCSVVFDAPNIGREEKTSLVRIINTGYVSTAGHCVAEFEEKFAGYFGIKKSVAVQSGTAAIHIALCELGIGPGDEVIVPVMTFVATVNPIIYNYAKPVFVDVDPATWNIDSCAIENHISKKTKAILPVHLYGNPCAMDRILSIARKHKLYVIEDAAESLGATYKGRYTGIFGDIGCFSFNGNKIITTGSGGMVVGQNAKRLQHIKFLVNQAKDPKNSFFHPEVGYNYRMTNLQAALGLAQMDKLNDFLAKKRNFNKLYRKYLSTIDGIAFQENLPTAESSWWLTGIVLNKTKDITRIQRKLMEQGIPTRRNFMPITDFPAYKKYKKGRYPQAQYIYKHGLCLPGSTLNSFKNIEHVCQILKKVVSKN